MLTPAYRLVIGDREVDTTDEPRASTVERLEVDLDLDTPADSLRLRLGSVDGLKPVEDDAATVELGYADESSLTLVLTGGIVSVEPGLTLTHVMALSPAQKLLALSHEETFQDMSAGEIVRKLAEEAGLGVARADAGTTFPAYVIDGRRSLYAHMRDLADLSGFLLLVDERGDVVFRPLSQPATTHVFEFAKHIVELEIERGDPESASVDVRGESPGTSRGEDFVGMAHEGLERGRGARRATAPPLASSSDPCCARQNPPSGPRMPPLRPSRAGRRAGACGRSGGHRSAWATPSGSRTCPTTAWTAISGCTRFGIRSTRRPASARTSSFSGFPDVHHRRHDPRSRPPRAAIAAAVRSRARWRPSIRTPTRTTRTTTGVTSG